jgi:hypothetical protein
LGRVIHLESSGKNRQRLIREIVVAIRELTLVESMDNNTRDIVSLIALNLWEINKSIDSSVLAWEKRGYWVKADRFRLEWDWTKTYGDRLASSIGSNNWTDVRDIIVRIAQKFSKVTIPINHRIKSPWSGSWDILNKQLSDK